MRLAGYAALFDRPDGVCDTIQRGAFARSLAERRDALPLFWQHRPDRRIGWVERADEDERGLRIVAAIDDPASRAAAMVEGRVADGLSFGYRARAFRHEPRGRVLEDIEIFEVSLVTHPMQHGARVHLITR